LLQSATFFKRNNPYQQVKMAPRYGVLSVLTQSIKCSVHISSSSNSSSSSKNDDNDDDDDDDDGGGGGGGGEDTGDMRLCYNKLQ
jgi:hypothetical protein